MRLYLDQMLRVELASRLRAAGHDVLRASETGQARADDALILVKMPLTAMFVGWLAFGTGIGLAQIPAGLPRVPAAEATNWFNQSVIVGGKLAALESSQMSTRLYFGNEYPEHEFKVSIPAENRRAFTNLEAAVGRMIEVRGQVIDNTGRGCMVLTNVSQLSIGEWEKTPADAGEQVAIRVAALAAAFERDREVKESQVVCHLKCYSCADSVEAAVVRGLSPYPVVRNPAKMSVFPDGTQRDEASGKRILVWTIKQITRSAGEVEVQVDCREHMVKGYGQAIRLRKIDGGWKVESCLANWLS